LPENLDEKKTISGLKLDSSMESRNNANTNEWTDPVSTQLQDQRSSKDQHTIELHKLNICRKHEGKMITKEHPQSRALYDVRQQHRIRHMGAPAPLPSYWERLSPNRFLKLNLNTRI
jgi:hypothetical protein